MALMLHALDVRDAHHVLEIGTGSGYNTALLCHRLGSNNVTTVDVDPALVERARERLASFGYHPHLEARDGLTGCPDRAPFDRIIATVGIRHVPPGWIAQTAPGAKMLVPLDLGGAAGLLALLTVHDDGTASGPFLSDYGGFMPTRANQHPATVIRSTMDQPATETLLPVDLVTDPRGACGFFAALMVDGYDWLGFTPDDGRPPETWLTHSNGSWACHITDATGSHTVRQGGPIRLWDEIERAHDEWDRLGRPPRERFGLTIQHGVHMLWMDEPTSSHSWLVGRYGVGQPAQSDH